MYWYEDEIRQLELKPVTPKSEKKRIVFYGSSSIHYWESIQSDFSEFEVINQGFGGSTLAACCWFFERVIPRFQPDMIVLYAGDNDLGDGRHPEEVFLYFTNILSLIQRHWGAIPVAFISVKTSPARQFLYNSIIYTNEIIRDEILRNYNQCTFVDIVSPMKKNGVIDRLLFDEDGLHLSKKGYEVWAKELKEQFLNQFLPAKKTSEVENLSNVE
ncbi:MAG: GDSL-type esterase/lipase family protein [Bacteroidales bacterium]